MVALGQPSEAVGHAQRILVPHGEDGQNAGGREPAKGEEQRSERVDVRPVGIIDQQDDDRLPFELLERLEEHGTHTDRFLGG